MKTRIEKALSAIGIELEDADTIEFQEIIPGITPPKIPLLIPGLEKLPLLPGWTVRDPGGKVLNQGARISLGDGETPEPSLAPIIVTQIAAEQA